MAQLDFLSHLEECVSTTESCASLLDAGIRGLQPGIEDLPRLSHVLRNSHRFVVLPAPTVQTHKNILSHALAPQIDNLIHKAETSIQAQKDKISRLEERLMILQESRRKAQPPPPPPPPAPSNSQAGFLDGIDYDGLSIAQRRSVMMLKGKRKRLEEERLALGV